MSALILVVDDEPDVADLFRQQFRRDVRANRYGIHEAMQWVIHHPTGEVRMWFWRTELAYRNDSAGVDDFARTMDPQWVKVSKALTDSASFVVLGFAGYAVAQSSSAKPTTLCAKKTGGVLRLARDGKCKRSETKLRVNEVVTVRGPAGAPDSGRNHRRDAGGGLLSRAATQALGRLRNGARHLL